MHRCSYCKEEKDESQFSKNKSQKLGINNYCKLCQRIKKTEHYETNKEVYKNKYAKYHAKKTNAANEYLIGKSCVDCGNDNMVVLEFDHRGDKIKNVAQLKRASQELFLAEVAKCDIVCANCHRIRTSRQFNWHKAKIHEN